MRESELLQHLRRETTTVRYGEMAEVLISPECGACGQELIRQGVEWSRFWGQPQGIRLVGAG